MANYAFIDWKDNMDILDEAPSIYYPTVCAGRTDEQIRDMEEENALPHGWENMDYEDFLVERRKLMAVKIKAAYQFSIKPKRPRKDKRFIAARAHYFMNIDQISQIIR